MKVVCVFASHRMHYTSVCVRVCDEVLCWLGTVHSSDAHWQQRSTSLQLLKRKGTAGTAGTHRGSRQRARASERAAGRLRVHTDGSQLTKTHPYTVTVLSSSRSHTHTRTHLSKPCDHINSVPKRVLT